VRQLWGILSGCRMPIKRTSIYFIRVFGFTATKIGISKNANRRLQNLQSANPFELRLISAIEVISPLEIEQKLKKRFKAQCLRGEWFDLSWSDIEEALEVIKPYTPKSFSVESSQFGKNDLLLDSDPLAQWADECLYFDPTLDPKTGLPKLKTRVGVAQKDEFGNFKNFRDSLYANYRQWLNENGHSRWISTRNFNAQLENLFQQFLNKKEVFHKRIAEGSYFFCIGFRANLPSH
jgi:Meiotically up-regulated gene 113/Poxvirus D5 protein-like